MAAKRKNDDGRRSVSFGVFGKMHLNKYQLRVRTWNPGDYNAVLKEEKEHNEERLELPTCRNLLYEKLSIRVKDINTGWQIPKSSKKQTFSADELWHEIPWRLFKFTRNDPPNVLEATISSSQNTNTFPELELTCEARTTKKHSKNPEDEPGTSRQLEQRIQEDKHVISRQTQRNPKEILDLNFGYIKETFVEWYKTPDSLSLLKLLYKNLVPPSVLADASKTIRDLINSLIDSSHVTNRDFTLFLETIKATGHFGLGTKIQDQIVFFPNAKEITISILKDRLKWIDFGLALTPENVRAINDFYNARNIPYKNSWELILDLETRDIICEKNMKPFIDSLNLMKVKGPLEILTKGEAKPAKNKKRKKIPEDEPGTSRQLTPTRVPEDEPGTSRQLTPPRVPEGEARPKKKKRKRNLEDEPGTSRQLTPPRVPEGEARPKKKKRKRNLEEYQ